MDDDEYGDIEGNEEGWHGKHFKVGEESVFDHVEVVFVILFCRSLVVQIRYLDLLHDLNYTVTILSYSGFKSNANYYYL